jgi:hypothetical protein
MYWLGFRVLEFAVADAVAGGHHRHITRLDQPAGAGAVLVLQRPVKDIADDLRVAMAKKACCDYGRRAIALRIDQEEEPMLRNPITDIWKFFTDRAPSKYC